MDDPQRIAYFLLAPISLIVHGLVLGVMSLVGGCWHIVCDMTLDRLTGRPLAPPRPAMVVLTPLVIAAAPLAVAIHLVIWIAKLLCWHLPGGLGRWQSGVSPPVAAVAIGWAWLGMLAAVAWSTFSAVAQTESAADALFGGDPAAPAIRWGLGLLAFVLLVRWPGLHHLVRGQGARLGLLVGRLFVAGLVVVIGLADSTGQLDVVFLWAGAAVLAVLATAAVWWLGWRLSWHIHLPGQYIAFMATRLLQKRRIAFFSIAAVTLCVAMVLIVISVMGGFLDNVRRYARGMLGDLIMENRAVQGFPRYQAFIDGPLAELRTEDGGPLVVAATPVIYTYGLLRLPTEITKTVQVCGIRLDEYVRVNAFGSGLQYDRWFPGTTTLARQPKPLAGLVDGKAGLPEPYDSAMARAKPEDRYTPGSGDVVYWPGNFEIHQDPETGAVLAPTRVGPELPGVICGRDVVGRRSRDGTFHRFYGKGDKMILTLLPLSPKGSVAEPTRIAARYADDSRVGIYDIDSKSVYLDFELLQQQLLMAAHPTEDGGTTRPRCNQVQIRLADGVDPIVARRRVETAWREFLGGFETDFDRLLMAEVEVQTWEQSQAKYIAAIENEKTLVTILFGVISVVAIFMVVVIFYMIVVEKTRDIGTIKAIGASSAGVAGVFLAYGAAIGLLGSLLGTALGTLFVRHINDVQAALARISPRLIVWNPEVYVFERIPDEVKVADAAWIAGIAVVASILGAVVPAAIAARRDPVEALRYE